MDEHALNNSAAKAVVLMPVYNAERYLSEAIASIIDQTFSDFTFLIINDGSTDNSAAIIESFDDPRILYTFHETNKGLIATLNEGLAMAKSEYIIRMDADDVSYPERIEKQIAFMDANPGIDISGCRMAVDGSAGQIAHPESPEACKVMLLDNTVLAHPSVIIRRESILSAGLQFKKDAIHAEDFQFWVDATIAGMKIANYPEVLMRYRTHTGQVSVLQNDLQVETVKKIRAAYADHFFGDVLAGRSMLYQNLLQGTISSFADFFSAKTLIKNLIAKNREQSYFDVPIFENYMNGLLKSAEFRMYVWGMDCNLNNLGKALFDRSFYTATSFPQKIRFILKSLGKASS